MMLWTEWWVWMAGALALATLEVIVPGYIFLGFALVSYLLFFAQAFLSNELFLPVK